MPRDVLERDVTLREQLRHKMLSRYRAHGLLGASSGGAFDGLGPAKPDRGYPEYAGRTALREELIEDGELVPVEVEGVRGTRFALRDEVELLATPPEPPASVAFLSPFDPLVWDRGLLGSLFEFDYVWDLFHPPEKRRFGYYVLPIIFRDRFVGRIEPKIDRSGGPVRYSASGGRTASRRAAPDGFVDAMRAALRAYLGFAGLTGSNGRSISARRSGSSSRGLEFVRLKRAASGTTTPCVRLPHEGGARAHGRISGSRIGRGHAQSARPRDAGRCRRRTSGNERGSGVRRVGRAPAAQL